MKRLISNSAILAILLSMIAVSCEDDYSTRIPKFDGVTLNPDKCIPGKEIELTLNVKDKGEHVYIYDTKITIVNDDNPKDQKPFTIPKGGFSLSNPTYKFLAPDSSGTYTISVQAKVSFSAGDVLYPSTQPPVQTAKLTVY